MSGCPRGFWGAPWIVGCPHGCRGVLVDFEVSPCILGCPRGLWGVPMDYSVCQGFWGIPMDFGVSPWIMGCPHGLWGVPVYFGAPPCIVGRPPLTLLQVLPQLLTARLHLSQRLRPRLARCGGGTLWGTLGGHGGVMGTWWGRVGVIGTWWGRVGDTVLTPVQSTDLPQQRLHLRCPCGVVWGGTRGVMGGPVGQRWRGCGGDVDVPGGSGVGSSVSPPWGGPGEMGGWGCGVWDV